MADRIDPTDRIGAYATETLQNLEAWLEQDNSLTDGQAEVVRHVVDHPDGHKRELNVIVEDGMTFRDLLAELGSSSPKRWGYPADDWETAERIRELRTDTELDDREAAVRALIERGRSPSDVAAMLNVSEAEIADVTGRIDRKEE